MADTQRFNISGRVQGVGFRAATQDKARELGLAGWVRNLPDGRVEARATGTADALEALRLWFEHGGPSIARVDRVDTTTVEAQDEPPHPFTVR
ncbi:acylphosphatase [Salinisphaera sp.]|uniref:acylphosphatase n=1 Tax=Salinisphaera sp. TaxID=1914330 RepID=UPI000C43B53F|nr:acylphosphatase [Salinisphaera sp.]MAS10453.1 acylphosphatase [Salinisphaera sp.]|tara:strand:- start:33 stop:311 length:279 start_codon:yes stop_codon:yes gene_type:complete